MNAVIDPLRQIARDLIDKKLWPIAVVLLAALVAVPTLIGSSDEPPAPAPLAATTGPGTPASAKSLITVVDQPVTGDDKRAGKIVDPFYAPPKPTEPAPTSSAAGPAATSSAATPAATPTGGGSETPSTASPGTTPDVRAERVVKHVYYRTELRWYDAEKAKAHPVSRLTPLGGPVDTAALYLGVTRSDGMYAVFLLGPGATSGGDAKCEDESCRVIGLKSGQTQLVTVQPADGGAAHRYVLEAVSVRAVETDAATARHMRAKVHPDGREAMRSMWQDGPTAEALRPVQYDLEIGLLVKGSGVPPVAKAALTGGE